MCFCDVARRGGLETVSERNLLAAERKSRRTCHPAHCRLAMATDALPPCSDGILGTQVTKALNTNSIFYVGVSSGYRMLDVGRANNRWI